MYNFLKSFFIIKSSSGPCHEDPGDPIYLTDFSMVDYTSSTNAHKTLLKSFLEIGYLFSNLFFFLKAIPILNSIFEKEIAFFRIGFKTCFVGIDWGWDSK